MSRGKRISLLPKLFVVISVLILLGLMVSSQAVAGTLYDQTSATFSSGWGTISNPDAYGGNFRYTNNLSSYVSFTFTGPSVSWIGFKDENCGIAEISVDGKKIAEIDLYASSLQMKEVLFGIDNLSGYSNTHTITIRPTGNKSGFSSNTYIVVDAFYVCPENICVVSPLPSELLTSGQGQNISVAINKSNTSVYNLALKCELQKWINPSRVPYINLIGHKQCDDFGFCPDSTWLVPAMNERYTTIPCQIATQLFKADESSNGAAASDIFLVEPAEGHGSFYIDPMSQTVSEGGSAVFEIKTEGDAPFWVATLRNIPPALAPSQQLQENYDITAFNYCSDTGHNNIGCTMDSDCPDYGTGETCVIGTPPGSRLHITDTGSSYTFAVQNDSDSCDTTDTVVIVVQDSTGHRTSALYKIDCP